MSNRWRTSAAVERPAPPGGWIAPVFAAGAIIGLPLGSALLAGEVILPALAAILIAGLAACLVTKKQNARAVPLWMVFAIGLLGFCSLGNGFFSRRRAEGNVFFDVLDDSVRIVDVRILGFPSKRIDGSRSVSAEMLAAGGRTAPPNVGVVHVAGSQCEGVDDWLPGQKFRIVGHLRREPPPVSMDELGPARFTLFVKSARLASGRGVESGAEALAGSWNAAAARRLARLAAGDDTCERGAHLVAALFLGRAGEIDPSTRSLYRRAGLAHLLSISGLHVALLLAAADALGRWAGLGVRSRLAAGAVIAMFFVPFAAASPPLIRAAAVAVLFAAARILERPPSLLALIAVAAAGELALFPGHFFDAGFELSYAASFGLCWLAPKFRRSLSRLPPWLAASLAATAAAELAALPIVAFRFGAVPLAGFAANLVLVPVFLASAAVGGAALPVSAISDRLAHAMLKVAGLGTKGGEWLLDFFAHVPGGFIRLAPRELAFLALGAVLLLVSFAFRGRAGTGLALAGSLLMVIAILSHPPLPGPGEIRIAALDVGQGDAVVVRSRRAAILVDGGGRTDLAPEVAAERTVSPELARLGVRRIDVAVLSHPHPDHCTGLIGVVATENVGILILPSVPDFGGCLENLKAAADRAGVPVYVVREGDVIRTGDLVATALAPPVHLRFHPGDLVNEHSLVLRVTGPGGAVLLPGDLQKWGEAELVDDQANLACDVLKVPHHGSRTSSSAPFLDRAAPRVALLSCGRRNPFGHPSPEVLVRYLERGVPVLRTDQRGTVEVTVKQGGPARIRFQSFD